MLLSIFDQINVDLVSIRDFFQTYKKILIQISSVQSQMNKTIQNNDNEGNIYCVYKKNINHKQNLLSKIFPALLYGNQF